MGLIGTGQRQSLDQDGYLILPALIGEPELGRFQRRFANWVERVAKEIPDDPAFSYAPDPDGRPRPGVLHKIQGVAVVDPTILELIAYPPLVDRVRELLGDDIDCFGTKFFPMDQPGATSTGWHTDNYYFGTNSERVVSCALYLHDTDTSNGCLRVVPGSHRTDRPNHAPGAGTMAHGHWADIDETQAVDVVCPAGTAVLFSANLLHGARPNISGRPSYRTAWHYLPGDLNLEQFPRGIYRDRHVLAFPDSLENRF